jgi:RNA polymerase sigma-70 factor (ECF subfamily)
LIPAGCFFEGSMKIATIDLRLEVSGSIHRELNLFRIKTGWKQTAVPLKKADVLNTDELDKNLESYYSRIYRAVSAYTHGTGLDPSDLTQETFFKAYKNKSSFEGSSTVYTWLYRIARNTCIDAMRKLKSSGSRYKESEFDENQYDTSGNDKDVIGRAEDLKLLRTALAKLPEDLRLLIILKDLQDLRYNEIAEITELNEGTVKSRLFRARLMLKQELLKTGYTYEA